jgi:hypothetical protein
MIGLSRGKRIVVLLSTLVFFALFFGSIAAFLAEPDGTFYLHHRASHTRIPLTREQGLAMMVPLIAAGAGAVVYTFWRSVRHAWKTARPGAVAPELDAGETVLWHGKQGWRSFGVARVAVTAVVIIVPALLLKWMWSIAAGADILGIKLFWLMFPGFILFSYVVPAIVFSSDALKGWMCEVFGSVAITRARIVWLTPITRRIYRAVAAADVVDACVTDSDGKHGSLTIIKRRGKSNVDNVYLDGLCEPERALAAVQSLITYRSPSDAQR